MKTLKIITLTCALFLASSVFAFTAFNLPIDNLPEMDNDQTVLFEPNTSAMDVVVSDNTNVVSGNMEDTILIDLAAESIGSPFPNGSRDCILKQVPYPEFARKKQLEGGVAVRFQFDDNGKVHIQEACSNSVELEQYVINKLTNLELKNCRVDMNKDYYLRFMFRLF